MVKFSSLLALAAVVAAGCNSLIGISDDATIVNPGAGSTGCLRNSDCGEPDVCLFEVCSDPCAADRDCDDGERCFATGDGTYCAGHANTVCATTDDCPAGSNCSDDVCRNPCEDPGDCLTDQECIAGYCLGSDAVHDPGIATPCTDGAIRCEGRAQALRSVCSGGAWEATDSCEGGQLCNSESDPPGECGDVEDACFGLEPNAFTCEGATRTTCGPDLVTVEVEECLSPQHCTAGTDGCAECLPNQYRCDDLELLICSDDSTGFEPFDTCTEEDPCNAEAGACTQYACLPDQKRCMGDLLQECNSTQSAFTTTDECGVGLCDPVELSCDICQANTKTCQDSGTALECNAEGTARTEVTCTGSETPFCQNGVCVECLEETDCDHGSCEAPLCNAGVCGTDTLGLDTECDGEVGYCDGEGTCQECTDPDHCPTPDECSVNTCVSFGCGTEPVGMGLDCSGGNQCDGDGNCVECLVPSDCDVLNEVCRAGICEDALHEHGWTGILGTDVALGANVLYVFRLPQLMYAAVLERFVVYGKAGAAGSYIMALYEGADDNPVGAPIAQMGTTQAWPVISGVKSVLATPADVPLATNKIYWLAIMANAAVTIGTQSSAGTGMRYPGQTLPNFPDIATAGLGQNSVDWNIYIGVKYTE